MNKKKCFVAWILICSMLVFYIPSMASDGSENSKAADTTVDVEITLEYRQQQARTIFDMVNEFRTGETWVWNEDNTKTTYQPNELSALTYDYTLEEVAMQRAAEIALHYSHTRTNGESCFTAFTEAGYPQAARGENIAVNQQTPEKVFIAWREEDKDYAGQGHRRNMLNANMTAIGIGYAYYNGTHYWTMELGSTVTQKTDSIKDGMTKARISVLNSYIESISTEEKSYTVACNGMINVPEVHTQMVTEETWTWPKGQKVSGVVIEPEWTVSDSTIAEISNGKITGKKVGSTVLTAKAGTKTTQITLNVTGFTLTDANVVLPEETFVYSGNEITPEPTVTYNGTVLEKGKDYTVSYKNNIEAGTEAAVIVTGTGNYSGEVIKNFTISTCAHKWDSGVVIKEASCEEDGIKTITCTICKETKTEVIPATGHKWDAGVVT
ncbi:MAG: CAP domain-containing protein, partial [Lachnospiraceae bacterium]|nr:CAP domain-containing protein [Lachnospiraceae bacterium]